MASMSYNGIDLPFVNITRFEQVGMYDEVGETDWYVSKFDITANAVLNTNYMLISINGGDRLSNPADIMRVIYSFLMKPRKKLSVTFNGVDLIPQSQLGLSGTVDAKNGPKPQSCRIIQLTDKTFMIVYHIIAHYWENNALSSISPAVNNLRGNNVLYNRWTETVDIDNKNFSTKIRDGVFAIRSDNADGKLVDEVRNQMAVVGLPRFFLRESAQYSISADGLTLRYQIKDKEVFKKPPSPAFTGDGSWTRNAPVLGAPKTKVSCNIRLEGDAGTSQDVLIARAFQICYLKIRDFAGGVPKSIIPTNCLLRAGFFSNWVEAHMSADLVTSNQAVLLARPRAGGIGLATVSMAPPTLSNIIKTDDNHAVCYTPISDDPGGADYVPPYLLRGTGNLLLQAAAYYDPSGVGTNLRTGFIAPPQNTDFEVGNAVVLSTGVLPGKAGVTVEP